MITFDSEAKSSINMLAFRFVAIGQYGICYISASNHFHYSDIIMRSKKTSKLRVTGLCVGNSPVEL